MSAPAHPILALLAQAAPTPPAPQGKSLLDHINSGGPIGLLILLLSFAAVALVIMHLVQIRRARLAPPDAIARLEELFRAGDIPLAARYCQDPDNESFLTRLFGGALVRCSRSPFGLLELRAALEEAGQQEVSRLYRSADGIGLIAAVAPMLGLLGTVVGMVGAFDTISQTEGFARPDQLAGDISVALITTVMGLVVAIPCTALYTFFRNRIDGVASAVGQTVEELAGVLESQQGQQSQPRPAPGAPGAQARSMPPPAARPPAAARGTMP